MTETAMITGYMNSRITPRLHPTPAMMKPNSPSWARLKPEWTAFSSPFPETITPIVTKMMSAMRTTMVIIRTVAQCSITTDGESIIPTETKNTTPKRSLIGVRSFSILSDCMVSARMDPITKAPRAEEKPTPSAKVTIVKHNPMLTISRISSLMYFEAFLRRVGIRYMPTRNHRIRKKASLPRLKSISPPAKRFETARDDSRTIRRMAIKSSMMIVPKTIWE